MQLYSCTIPWQRIPSCAYRAHRKATSLTLYIHHTHLCCRFVPLKKKAKELYVKTFSGRSKIEKKSNFEFKIHIQNKDSNLGPNFNLKFKCKIQVQNSSWKFRFKTHLNSSSKFKFNNQKDRYQIQNSSSSSKFKVKT